MPQITNHEKIFLKNTSIFSEKNIQDKIAEDPSILGLGELELKDKERIQEFAGRLDLLLQNPESKKRYEVEIQLGKVDESHIIRTIEYRDIERKRFPQYDHCAVIIAEEITSRFLNVISLFNGSIPLIAMKLDCIKVGEQYALIFTKILDEVKLGFVDEDENASEPGSKDLRIKKGSEITVNLVIEIHEKCISIIDRNINLNYTKHYIGFSKNGSIMNFAYLRARKRYVSLELKRERSEILDSKLNELGIDYRYNDRYMAYWLDLHQNLLNDEVIDFLRLEIRASYDNFVS